MFLPVIKPILRIAATVASLLLFALTILSAYGGRFDTEIFTFPAILVLVLPYLAMVTLAVTVIWFVCGRYFVGGIGVLALIASWGPISTVSPLSGSKEGDPDVTKFTFMTYNMIHGWDQEGKDSTANRTIEYLINSGVDIINVQELVRLEPDEVTGMTEEQKERLLKTYPYFVGDPANDMKVFSKYPVIFENGYNYIDGNFDKRRYSFFKFNIKGHKMVLINVHLQSFMLSSDECQDINNATSIESVKALSKNIFSMQGSLHQKLRNGFQKRRNDVQILRNTIDRMKGATLISGDFNDVPESYAYRLLKGDDLHDAYVETGFGPMITFNAHKFWFHLDHIFYRGPLKALDVEKGTVKFSDHYPLVATFEFTDESTPETERR